MSQGKKEQSPKKEQTKKEPKPFGEPVTESDESEDGEDDKLTFTSDEEVAKGRKDALALYNSQKYEDAQKIQVACCEYWSKAKGDLSKENALATLDYGLTQLALLESKDSEHAALGGLVENANEELNDEYESCYEVLQISKMGWEKAEKAKPKDQDIQQRLIEVHDAIASFHEEAGDDESATQEYELVKALNSALDKPSKRREYVADYCIARCYCKAENWTAALEPITAAVARIAEDPEAGAELVDTIKATFEEVKEMCERGGMEDIKEEIRGYFPDENSQVLDPEQTMKEETNTNAFVTPLPSDLANHNKAVSNSIPLALIAPIAPKEGSNSVSFIHPLGGIPPAPGTPNPGAPRSVNVVAVRKKPKSSSLSNGNAPSAPGSPSQVGKRDRSEGKDENGAPATKKARKE